MSYSSENWGISPRDRSIPASKQIVDEQVSDIENHTALFTKLINELQKMRTSYNFAKSETTPTVAEDVTCERRFQIIRQELKNLMSAQDDRDVPQARKNLYLEALAAVSKLQKFLYETAVVGLQEQHKPQLVKIFEELQQNLIAYLPFSQADNFTVPVYEIADYHAHIWQIDLPTTLKSTPRPQL